MHVYASPVMHALINLVRISVSLVEAKSLFISDSGFEANSDDEGDALSSSLPSLSCLLGCGSIARIAVGGSMMVRQRVSPPPLNSTLQKPSAELKELCLKAFEVQMAQLLKAEPDNERYINKLKREQRDVERVDADKADREAVAAVREYERARK